MPLLGYDVDLRTTQLVVNEEEGKRVRAIFRPYQKKPRPPAWASRRPGRRARWCTHRADANRQIIGANV
jgi:hypothetical protein